MSSPENHSSSGQLSDSYYSNESSNSTPDTERSGSKKTAYNEKWGVKVLKGKNHISSYSKYMHYYATEVDPSIYSYVYQRK